MRFVEFWRINAVVLAVLVAIVSLVPNPEDMGPGLDWSAWIASLIWGDPTDGDKVAHFMAYTALGFFSGLGFVKNRSTLAPVQLGIILYGAGIEVAQTFTHQRTGDLLDLAANGLGATSGVLLSFLARHLYDAMNIPRRERLF